MLRTEVVQTSGLLGFFFGFLFGVIALKKFSSLQMLSVELSEQNLSDLSARGTEVSAWPSQREFSLITRTAVSFLFCHNQPLQAL